MIRRALTQEDRVTIIRLNAQGRNLWQIGCSHSTVQTYLARIEHNPFVDRRHANPGRPRLIDDPKSRLLQRAAHQNPFFSVNQLLQQLNLMHISTNPTNTTSNHLLRTLGMRSRSAAIKPFLSAVHRATRLQFARAHEDWTVED